MKLKIEVNRVRSDSPSRSTEVSMISLADLIGFSDLTPDEVQAIAEHEHVVEMVAVVLGSCLLQSDRGCEQIRDMLMDNLRTAVRRDNVPHARQGVSTLRHSLHAHPNVTLHHAG